MEYNVIALVLHHPHTIDYNAVVPSVYNQYTTHISLVKCHLVYSHHEPLRYIHILSIPVIYHITVKIPFLQSTAVLRHSHHHSTVYNHHHPTIILLVDKILHHLVGIKPCK